MLDIRDHGGSFGGGSKKEFELDEFGLSSLPAERIIHPQSNENLNDIVYDPIDDVYYTKSLISGSYYLRRYVEGDDGILVVQSQVLLPDNGTISFVGKYTPYIYLIINNYPVVYNKSDLSLETDKIPTQFRSTYSSPLISESSSGKIYLITMPGSFTVATMKEFQVDTNGFMTHIADYSFAMTGAGATAINGIFQDDFIYMTTTDINSRFLFSRWNMRNNARTVRQVSSNFAHIRKDNSIFDGHMFIKAGSNVIRKYEVTSAGDLIMVSSVTFYDFKSGDYVYEPILNYKDFIGIGINTGGKPYLRLYKINKENLSVSSIPNHIFYGSPRGTDGKGNSLITIDSGAVSKNYIKLVRD